MNPIAIDIVLVPPVGIIRQAIMLNRNLDKQPNPIALNEKDCVPHISLAMGLIESEKLPELTAYLKDCLSDFTVNDLEYTGTYQTTEPGSEVCGIMLNKPLFLKSLNSICWDWIMRNRVNNYAKGTLTNSDGDDFTTIKWIENFENHTGDNFKPHITIGFGRRNFDGLKGNSFLSDQLAVYQLGKFCTCRKWMSSIQLKSE